QMAKAAGARVITGSSSDDKLDKARALGADEVLNYQQAPEFSKRVRELTDGHGVGLVFESIGAPVWDQCFASIKKGGRLVICGVTGGHKASIHLGQLWMKEISIFGCINEPENDLEDVVTLIEAGSIRGVIDSVLPLDSTEQAYDRMKERNFFGKVILTVP
ncbi:MAG: zinc-binding dehydrogenase, partial [Chloroflexi bacterium]|nr:zinc-binding dehydrogenase [Chloroflexota bacterium]